MARYTAKEIVNNDTDVETKHHEWIPARPENYKFDRLMTRLKHAWYVIGMNESPRNGWSFPRVGKRAMKKFYSRFRTEKPKSIEKLLEP